MKEIKQKPAGGKPKTADAARVPKAVVKAAWLQAREAARAGEKQVVGGKDGAYSGAADTGEKGADKLVSTGERVTELAYRGGRKLAERSAGQRRERAKAAQTGGEAAQRHGAGETIAHEKQVQALEAGALEQLVLFLIIMLTVNIVAIIIENLDGLLTQKMQLEITRNFGKPVFEYIQNVPLYHMSDSNFVADKERAINAVENDILLVVQNINGSIALIVSIIVLSVMVAQYDVLALVVLIIMVIVQNVFTKRGTSEGVELNKSLEMFKIKEAYFNKLFVDKNSSKEIRQWRLTDYIEGKRYWLNEEIKRKTLDLEKKWTGINLFWACVMYFFEFIYYIVLYIRYTRGSVMLGTLIYLIQVLSTYLVSFTQVIQHIKIIASIKYEIDTYFEFAEKTNGKPNIAKSRKNKSKKIIFENVDFEYKKRRLLQEISFSINPGEKILIVGENGSGKSTLLNLILGLLQPTRGKVDIGANKIALMAQESYKFNITIRENIIFSKEKNRDSLILNTMQKLTALSIVGRLENGLDTRIGASLYDDGIDLSGGETQKIVATRTLLDNADIWIFDEPVAAMDPSSEYSFFNTVLEEDDKSKTMIFVSHRLKIASKMNRIIYLENGKIVGIGTHQQLMTGCEKYRRYYVSWLLMEND